LIIDDHPSFRASARNVLEDAGFVVIGEAQDGASGLAAATEMRPAVVLLDIQLPDIDGFDVAARLTAQDNGPAVVLTSSHDGSEFGGMRRAQRGPRVCTQGRAVGACAGGAARMIARRRGLIGAGHRTTTMAPLACA
jgi:CheY-like chemotaxis protein